MIKIYENNGDNINVSKEYIEEAVAVYIKNNILEVHFESIKLVEDLNKKIDNYSLIIKLDNKKYNVKYSTIEWVMENIKFYLYKNFNMNCIISIGVH